ncbi:MAG: hypothetical protein ACLQU3_16750 [Limisphaerales bacterium]
MSNQRLRSLYFSNAFPPGVGERLLSVNPAGHATETRMAEALQYPPCMDWLPVFLGQADLGKLCYVSSSRETYLH